MKAAINVVDEIKVKLVAAKEPGVDRNKIQSEIGELQKQLSSIATSASFSGENWLSFNAPANTSKSVVASFNRSSTGAVSVGTIDINISSLKLFGNDGTTPVAPAVAPNNGILDTMVAGTTFLDVDADATTDRVVLTVNALDISTTALDQTKVNAATGEATVGQPNYKSVDDVLNMMITNVDTAIQSMTTAASNLGAAKSRMDIQSEFVSNLRDSIEKGVGTLVDADMTEESTRLKALQTQQQLGVQALSIANSSSQSLLSLFR